MKLISLSLLIATFPGTKPTSELSITAYKSKDGKSSSKKAEQRVVSAETDKVSFSAANFGPNAVRNNQCKYVQKPYNTTIEEYAAKVIFLVDILLVFTPRKIIV